MSEKKGRIIHVLGNNQMAGDGYERYRDFHCFGQKNADVACAKCKLRFQCFTDRENIELSHNDFNKKSVRDVNAKLIAETFVPELDYKIVTDDGKKKVVLDFERKEEDGNV